jgi:hypothetical protein
MRHIEKDYKKGCCGNVTTVLLSVSQAIVSPFLRIGVRV